MFIRLEIKDEPRHSFDVVFLFRLYKLYTGLCGDESRSLFISVTAFVPKLSVSSWISPARTSAGLDIFVNTMKNGLNGDGLEESTVSNVICH